MIPVHEPSTCVVGQGCRRAADTPWSISTEDQDRADELADKGRAGGMTPQEEHELEDYLTIGSALEFLKSKARLSLGRSGASS